MRNMSLNLLRRTIARRSRMPARSYRLRSGSPVGSGIGLKILQLSVLVAAAIATRTGVRRAILRDPDRAALRGLPYRRVRSATHPLRAGLQAARLYRQRRQGSRTASGRDDANLLHAHHAAAARWRRAGLQGQRQLRRRSVVALLCRHDRAQTRRLHRVELRRRRPAGRAQQCRYPLCERGPDASARMCSGASR